MRSIVRLVLAMPVPLALLACGGSGEAHRTVADAPPPPVDACCPTGPGDWPQFRGPARDGTSPATGLADSWAEGGPEVLWRAPAGPGFAAVSVVGDGVYTAWAENGREVLVRLDAATGERRWLVDLGPEFEEEYGNGPRATPAIGDDGAVYAMSSWAAVFAVDAASGEVRWTVDLRETLDTGPVEHRGHSSSPLLVGGTVVVNVGPDVSFVALDRRDGSTVWTSGRGKSAVGSPVLLELGGSDQIVTTSAEGLVGLDPATGARLWSFPWPTQYGLNIASPLQVGPDRVMISSGYDQGAAVVEVARSGDGWTVAEVWTERTFRNHWSTSVLVDGAIYGFDNAILECVRAEDGSECWQGRGFGKGGLIAADGKLLILGDGGNVGMVRAAPEDFELLGDLPVLGGRCWTAPALAGGVLYVRDDSEVAALRLPRAEDDPAGGASDDDEEKAERDATD